MAFCQAFFQFGGRLAPQSLSRHLPVGEFGNGRIEEVIGAPRLESHRDETGRTVGANLQESLRLGYDRGAGLAQKYFAVVTAGHRGAVVKHEFDQPVRGDALGWTKVLGAVAFHQPNQPDKGPERRAGRDFDRAHATQSIATPAPEPKRIPATSLARSSCRAGQEAQAAKQGRLSALLKKVPAERRRACGTPCPSRAGRDHYLGTIEAMVAGLPKDEPATPGGGDMGGMGGMM